MRSTLMTQHVKDGVRQSNRNIDLRDDTDHACLDLHSCVSARIDQRKVHSPETGKDFFVVTLYGRDKDGNTICLDLFSESRLLDNIELRDTTKKSPNGA